MNRAQIEIDVLEEAITNLNFILNSDFLGGKPVMDGIQMAINELQNMIDETRDAAE